MHHLFFKQPPVSLLETGFLFDLSARGCLSNAGPFSEAIDWHLGRFSVSNCSEKFGNELSIAIQRQHEEGLKHIIEASWPA